MDTIGNLGGQVELVAFAKRYKYHVSVFHNDSNEEFIFGENYLN